jgi:NAD(P)H-flavin reductase
MTPSPLVTLPIRRITRVSRRAALVALGLDPGSFRFDAGQAALLGLEGGVRKPYSIASSPEDARDRRVLEFLVGDGDAENGARVSGAPVGARVEVEGPVGSLVLPDPLDSPHVLLVAGGTGVAPMRSIWRHLLARADRPRLTLVYSARTAADVAFGQEIDALVAAGHFGAVITLSRARRADPPRRTGRVDVDLLRSVGDPRDMLCCICGPTGLAAAVVTALKECGVAPGRILAESW